LRRLLVDLNVVLDVLLDRRPHVVAAARVWEAIETGRFQGVLPAHAFTTVHYLAARARSRVFARRTIDELLRVFDVARVDAAVIRKALSLEWPDFEDAVCASAAVAAGCDTLITRDPDGFPDPPLRVIDPETALAGLGLL
jgi:predicted nucleic acid-binding protein